MILRFLGTTPGTSNIIQALNSIFHQICRIYNLKLPTHYMDSHTEIKNYLIGLLCFLSVEFPHKKLIIILDSLDQLINSDYALDWLLFSFPPNIKMIYSVIPDHANIFGDFKSNKAIDPDFSLIEIKSLDPDMARLILTDWLKKESRSLSVMQWNSLQSMFEKSEAIYPLYIRIIFDIVSKWPSFYEPDKNFTNCLKIDECIEFLFKSLEKFHGKLLFARTIIYMTMFKNGISENELEDILSLDDDVLYDIFEFHAPPIRKLPLALWSRIKHDLKSYIVEKEIDSTRVISWYHRRFIEVANSYYIGFLTGQTKETVVQNVVDFFNETWKYKPKPFKYNEFIAQKKHLASLEGGECRNTSIQPTYMIDKNTGNIVYNLRKIKELPQFIASLNLNMALPLVCEQIYFNYHFLTGLISNCEYLEIILYLFEFIKGSPFRMTDECKEALSDLRLMTLVIIQIGSIMKDNSKSAVLQLLSKSMSYYGFSKHFTKLIDEYDRESVLNCSLLLTGKTRN